MSNTGMDSTAARADFCRYLAACYYEPGPELAEEAMFDSMRSAAERIDPQLAATTRTLGRTFADSGLEELKREYLRLFLGPADAPARPYGSLWLGGEGRLMQDSTMAVQALYKAGGFEIDPGFMELPDHIAAELEFLYALLFHESRGQKAGTVEEPADPAMLRKRLLAEHLGRWVAPFTASLRAAARVAYYRELADVTRQFVAAELDRVGSSNVEALSSPPPGTEACRP